MSWHRLFHHSEPRGKGDLVGSEAVDLSWHMLLLGQTRTNKHLMVVVVVVVFLLEECTWFGSQPLGNIGQYARDEEISCLQSFTVLAACALEAEYGGGGVYGDEVLLFVGMIVNEWQNA